MGSVVESTAERAAFSVAVQSEAVPVEEASRADTVDAKVDAETTVARAAGGGEFGDCGHSLTTSQTPHDLWQSSKLFVGTIESSYLNDRLAIDQ